MLVDAKLFAQAVDRVATISAEKSRSVRMAIEPGRMILTVRNMEAGQAVEELEIDYSGESFELPIRRAWSPCPPFSTWPSSAESHPSKICGTSSIKFFETGQ
jgi:hypothetical protein